MLNTIEKAKEIGAITLDRINDYMDLIRVELDITQRHVVSKVSSVALMGVMALFAAIFVGVAIIVSFWDTPYRIVSAWAIALFWVAAAAIAYFQGRKSLKADLEIGRIRHALQQDIQFLRELL